MLWQVCAVLWRRAALCFSQPVVKPSLQQLLHLFERSDPRVVGGVAAAVIAAGGITWWIIVSRRPSAEEMEHRRRESLAVNGRITDGLILDARTLRNEESISPTPEVLVYSYSCAGLTYNCAQDVSALPDRVLGYRIDQSVQVRYDPRNPGNSILVSESWSGLWLRDQKH
jgi:hypothetical protein